MNKTLILFYACFLLSSYFVIAQDKPKQIAEFKKELKAAKEDTNKVRLAIKFAAFLGEDSIKLGNDIINKARLLAEKLNYPQGIALSAFQQGIYFEINKDHSSAIRYYRKAAQVAEKYHLYTNLDPVYNASLNMYYYLADYPNAMETAQKGLALAEQLNNREEQMHYLSQIGYIYQKQEKPDEAIKYFRQYLTFATLIDNKMMIADACDGLAEGYQFKQDYKTALSCLFKSLGIYYKMKRSETLDKGRVIFKNDRIVYTLFKLSTVYKLQGDYKEALHYSQIIFDEHINKGEQFNKYDLARYYINMGDIYIALKDHRKASQMLNNGLFLARSIMHREDTRDAYNSISKNFAATKRYDSAYFYHILFTGLKDSIINEKVSKEINKLEVDRRDREITVLQQQQKLRETETASQNLSRNFIIGFVALFATISFLLLYIKSRIKQQKLVFEKKLAVQLERQRISSDMHDDIGTGLSTMLIYVNMLRIKLEGSEESHNIKRISALGDELVGHMKEIVWSLSPGNDRLDNLLLYMRQYFVLLFEPLAYGAKAMFPANIPELELKSETRRNIFLCVKEALNNVIKHANATSVELEVHIKNNKLVIRIKDNGSGYPAIPCEQLVGNGISNIKRRMSAINGTYKFFNNNGAIVLLETDL